MTASLDSARQILAEALEVEPETVSAQARLGDPEAWDSLAHLRLILAIEAKLGHELGPDQIIAIESLDDVAAILNGKAS
ncbi:MAG: acyl carrier protein [Pseudomonadota bacterium]